MNVKQRLEQFQIANPDYYMAAGEHLFACRCAACITFLALTGLECLNEGDPLPEWSAIAAEPVGLDGNPSDSQVERIWQLAALHL